MPTKTYDSAQVSVIVGVTPIVGFAKDSGVSIDWTDETYSETQDNRGNIARSKINTINGLIELNLAQDSVSNDVLSSYAEADRINNAGTFAIFIKDNNGTSLFQSTDAWVKSIAKVSFATELGVNTWTIRACNMGIFIGGVK